MSGGPPERPGADGLVAALPLRRNAALGVAIGVAVGAGVYAVRVTEALGPAPSRGSPLLFLALAFVLASAAAGLVASLLTLASLYRVLSTSGE